MDKSSPRYTLTPFAIAVAVTDSPLLGPAKTRVGLIVNSDAATPFFLSLTGVAAANLGIRIPAAVLPLVLTPGEWG